MAKKATAVRLPLGKKLLFTATVVVCLLLGLEWLLRLCGYSPQPDRQQPMPPKTGKRKANPLEYFAVCDRYLGFRNRPNGSYRTWYIEGEPLVTTDRFGYRNGFGWSADGDSPIVVFVGDSYTFCSEVSDRQTGPSEVAKLLSQEFDVRVLNAGVRGYGTLQAKRMLIESLKRFPRIKAAVYTVCGNDLEETMVPNLRYPLKAPVMVRDDETGQFREIEVAEPAVPWGEGFYGWQAPEPVPSTPAKLAHWLETRSVLCHRCLAGWRRVSLGLFHRPEFPDGKRVVSPARYAQWHDWAVRNGADEVLRRLLVEMDRACRAHGATLVVTCALGATTFEASRALSAKCAAHCAAAGVRFVSLENQFTGNPRSYSSRRTDDQCDAHYGPLGTQAYARALAPAFKQILRSQAFCRRSGDFRVAPEGRASEAAIAPDH